MGRALGPPRQTLKTEARPTTRTFGRFAVAEVVAFIIVFAGFDGPQLVRLGMFVCLLLATGFAYLWASRRLSKLAAGNCFVVVVLVSATAADSGVGGPSRSQLLMLGAAGLAVVVGWVTFVVRASRHQHAGDERVHLGVLLAPLAGLAVAVVIVTGLPSQARFAASRSDLDQIAAKAEFLAPALDSGGLCGVPCPDPEVPASEVPSFAGEYKVQAVSVSRPLTYWHGTIVTVYVEGDCGNDALGDRLCTLVHYPQPPLLGSGDVDGRSLGGGWYARATAMIM